MKTFYFIKIILTLLCFNFIQAQEYKLSFKVIEQATGKPLQNTDIFIQTCSCGGVTDASGVFSKHLTADTYLVTISYVGFKKDVRTVILNKDTLLKIQLQEDEKQLSEVILNAKKISNNLESPQMGVIQLKAGDLDLFVLNHSTQEYAGFSQITSKLKNRKNIDFGDKLYRNDNGKFTDVTDQAGVITNVLGFGLGITVSDFNNDGWLDMYISNDYNEQDYLYINNHDGTFTESLKKYINHVSLFSMGADAGDINNDGYTDLISLDMLPEDNYRQKMVSGPDNFDKFSLLYTSGFYNQTMRNMLQLNNQGQSFSEIGQFSGVSNTDWSWAPLIADFDNDGYKDLYITNGYKRDYTNMDFMNYMVQERLDEKKGSSKDKVLEDLLKKAPAVVIENYMYHNNKDLSFKKVITEWGLNQKSLSNGAAYADLDNDGDLDLVVNNIDQEAFVYRNNSEIHTKNHYLKIKLKGDTKNTFGIGSKIKLFVNNQILTQELIPSRGFQSSSDYTLVFGLGEQTTISKIKITWPDDKVQLLENIKTDQTITLNQNEAALLADIKPNAEKKQFFTDITIDSIFNYTHKENNYVDFRREKLLPHQLSTQGPRITKGDINNDGLEDVFIGGAKGSPGKLYLQTKTGKFNQKNSKVFEADSMSEDIGVLFFDVDNDKDLDLYVVSGGNDYNENSPELQDRLYFNDGKGHFKKSLSSLPQMITSGSCITAGDYDNDGDLDLFVGGRLVPGKYPTIPRSYLLENDGKGNFKDITTKVNPAVTLGLAMTGMFPWAKVGIYIAAEMIGASLGALLVWLTYHDHFKVSNDKAGILAIFSTSPAIRNYKMNLITEVVGTFVNY